MADDGLTEVYVKLTRAINIGAQTAFVSNFAANVLVSSTLNYLWGFVHVMQIITHFPLINVLMPANCQELFRIFVKIVTYDLIPIDGIMDMIDQMYEI